MSNQYILKHRKPIPCDDLYKWADWFEKSTRNHLKDRQVRRTYFPNGYVSTVFLGLDHGWDGNLELFETMIFDKKGDEEGCWRCATWRQALKMHWDAVKEYKDNDRKTHDN